MSFIGRRSISPGLDVPQNEFVLNAGDDMAQWLIAWYPAMPSWIGKRLIDRSLYGNPDILPNGTDVVPFTSSKIANFKGPETSNNETLNGLYMFHGPATNSPLAKVHLAGNDFSVAFVCQVIKLDGQGQFLFTGNLNQQNFMAIRGNTAETLIEVNYFSVGTGGDATTSLTTSDQKAFNDLMFVVVSFSRSTGTVNIYVQGGQFSTSGTIFDTDYSGGLSNFIYGGDLSRWAHIIWADISWFKRALTEAEAFRLYDPSTRWNLRYQLGRRSHHFLAPAAGQTIAVGLATETDAALGTTINRTIAAGLSAETNAGLAVGRLKAAAVGLSIEADAALAATPNRAHTVALAPETDLALAAGHSKTVVAGLAGEADQGLAVGSTKVRLVGLASEIDVSLAVIGTVPDVPGGVDPTTSGAGVAPTITGGDK